MTCVRGVVVRASRGRTPWASLVLAAVLVGVAGASVEATPAEISWYTVDGPPMGPGNPVAAFSPGGVMLSGVPTSSWTYGCSATSAGMMFGYYDRLGYVDLYTGPANGGVAPLADLGNECSIIATQQGFDGRTTAGHVDDYWIGYNSPGPDPWVSGGVEHAWGDCLADYMGTNQWKWDYDGNRVIESNPDGATTFFYYTDGSRLYDFIPWASAELPQTELCHGLRLFAEACGYGVAANYTQMTDNVSANGFTFNDYMAEIDAGRPVMIQVEGHSMVGVGYDLTGTTVYLHDTWGDYVASMTWGGPYGGMGMVAVTVLELEPPGAPAAPEPVTLAGLGLGLGALVRYVRRRAA